MSRYTFLFLIFVTLGLAGCVTPAQPSAAAPSSAVAANDEPNGSISFLIFGDPAEKAAYDELVSAYQKLHSDVNVELIHVPSQGDYRRRLAADFAAGAPADITLINYRRYAQFAAKGTLEPLGPYLAQSKLIKEDDFYSEAMAPYYWEGTLMCIPQNLSSLAVYYNKKLFDEAGLDYPSDDWNWDEFLADAKALTKDNDGDGETDVYGLGTDAVIFRAAPFIWMNGGDLVDDPANPHALALDTPEAKEALEWFIDLQVVHQVVPDFVKEQAENSESRFISGRLGMFLNSRRGVPTYRQIEDFDWDVAPLPQGKSKSGILHADAFCLSAASQNKSAAWSFIEFANSVEGQTILAKSGRTVPSLKSVAESPAFLDPNAKPANSRVFLDTIPYIRAVPIMETWVDIETVTSEELENAFHGGATLDAAIDAAVIRSRDFWPKK